MAANEISERKRIEQERKKEDQERSRNADKVLKLGMDFLEYQDQIKCDNAIFKEIVSDDDIVNGNVSSNDVLRTEQLFSGYKRQLKEFMRYGGNPFYIYGECDSNKMDLYIEIARRLNDYDLLDKQEYYVMCANENIFSELERDREFAQRERHQQEVIIPKILNNRNNELTEIITSSDYRFVPYKEEQNSITIDKAYSFDKTSPDFFSFLNISIIFNDKYIFIYNREHDKMYYKADVTRKNVEVLSVSANGFCEAEVNGLQLLFDEELEQKVSNMYLLHNLNLSEHIQYECEMACDNINSLSGVEFERVCKRLLENMGFAVELTKTTGDGGIDLIAYNSQPLLSGKYIIQCKRYTGSVGEPIIRDLYGVVTAERANKGILMTSGLFTKQARLFAEEKPIELIDGVKLRELLKDYYN